MSRPGGEPNTGVVNWYDLRRERSKGIEDVPQRLVFTALWALPYGQNMSGWRRQAIGGWQINTITTIQSGSPIALIAPGTSGAIGTNRPNVVAGENPRIDNPTIARWFNTAAFSVPAPFTFGNASRTLPNALTDGLFNMDLSILKDFRITEGTRLQFRAEAFNLTNTPTFGTPDRNVASRTFGVVNAAAFYPKPREVQLALRYIF